jgi:hypothetical protein
MRRRAPAAVSLQSRASDPFGADVNGLRKEVTNRGRRRAPRKRFLTLWVSAARPTYRRSAAAASGNRRRQVTTSEPVVAHHGREVGRCRSRRCAAVRLQRHVGHAGEMSSKRAKPRMSRPPEARVEAGAAAASTAEDSAQASSREASATGCNLGSPRRWKGSVTGGASGRRSWRAISQQGPPEAKARAGCCQPAVTSERSGRHRREWSAQ